MYDITALGEILIDFTYQGIGRNDKNYLHRIQVERRRMR